MIQDATSIGGPNERFPSTRWSLLRNGAPGESAHARAAIEHLAGLYWRPVYLYVRKRWALSNEDAKDLTQDFFLALQEKDWFLRLSPEQGRFRTYVMKALDNFARLRHRHAGAKKRGGGIRILPMEGFEEGEPSHQATPEQILLREWARSILEDALSELESEYLREGKPDDFQLLVSYDLPNSPDGPPSYEGLSKRLGISVDRVTTALYRGRQRLRQLVLHRITDTLSSPQEAEAELRELFENSDVPSRQ